MLTILAWIGLAAIFYVIWVIVDTYRKKPQRPTHKKPASQQPDTQQPQTKPQPSRLSQLEAVLPKVYQIYNLPEFTQTFNSVKPVGEMGDVIMGPVNDQRIHGAMVNLTPNIIHQRTQAIRDGLIQRDDNERRQAWVPGYDEMHTDVVVDADQQILSLWHRTHLIPFNWSLSEGERIQGLLFPGTAHLNRGDRPQYGYVETEAESQRRGENLFNMYRRYHQLNLNYPKDIAINGTAPNGTHLSLDDIERLSAHIINSMGKYKKNGNYAFRYEVMCLYPANTQTPVPNQIKVKLIDLHQQKVVLSATLPNVK